MLECEEFVCKIIIQAAPGVLSHWFILLVLWCQCCCISVIDCVVLYLVFWYTSCCWRQLVFRAAEIND